MEAKGQITVKNGYGVADSTAEVLVPRRHGMATPKVSVVMPVYNTEAYLRECLDSVAAQSLREIEIICVDDGSTDSSLQILQEYAEKDGRFIILTEKNLRSAVARNAGVGFAKGEFLSVLDSDDYFEPSMLADAYTAATRDGSDVVLYGHYECGEGKDDITGQSVIKKKFVAKSPVDVRSVGREYLLLNISSAWNKLFRREIVEKHGVTFLDVPNAEDLTFACTMCALAGKISLLPQCYVHYRRGRAGNLMTRRREFFESFAQAVAALEGNLRRFHASGAMMRAFRFYASRSCRFEFSLCQDKAEVEEKLAVFDRVCGKALGDMVRGIMTSGPMRWFYYLRAYLRRLSGN